MSREDHDRDIFSHEPLLELPADGGVRLRVQKRPVGSLVVPEPVLPGDEVVSKRARRGLVDLDRPDHTIENPPTANLGALPVDGVQPTVGFPPYVVFVLLPLGRQALPEGAELFASGDLANLPLEPRELPLDVRADSRM